VQSVENISTGGPLNCRSLVPRLTFGMTKLLMTRVGAGADLVPRLGARIIFDIDFPALPGWAHVWRPAPSTSSGQALWASHPWRLQCHLFLNLPQASRLLGMTRGRVRLTAAAVIGDGQSRRLFAIFISSGGNPFACFAIRNPLCEDSAKCDPVSIKFCFGTDSISKALNPNKSTRHLFDVCRTIRQGSY
jgi:hypothetical protein